MKSYKDLEIYKLSYELAVRIHKFSLTFPRYEIYEEGGQIKDHRRAFLRASLKVMGGENIRQNSLNSLLMPTLPVMERFCTLISCELRMRLMGKRYNLFLIHMKN